MAKRKTEAYTPTQQDVVSINELVEALRAQKGMKSAVINVSLMDLQNHVAGGRVDALRKLHNAIAVAENKGIEVSTDGYEAYKRVYYAEVTSICKYCGREYTWNAGIGNLNHGACFRSRCVSCAMRDSL